MNAMYVAGVRKEAKKVAMSSSREGISRKSVFENLTLILYFKSIPLTKSR